MAKVIEPGKAAVKEQKGIVALANDYLTLTKPPIIVLLVITAIGGMFLAAEGIPSLKTLALVSIGGALGAGGANAINHFLDQDIDSIMSRTVRRPRGQSAHTADKRPSIWSRIKCRRIFCPDLLGEPSSSLPNPIGYLVLRTRLYGLAQTEHPTEHSDRGRSRLYTTNGRLGSSDRQLGIASPLHVYHHFLLDPSSLLGAGPDDPR